MRIASHHYPYFRLQKMFFWGLWGFFLMMGSLLKSPPVYGESLSRLVPIMAKIEEEVQTYLKAKRIPGCAIAVVYQNQIVYLKGFGVRTLGKQETIDTETVFQLGSVSKPIAATLASLLEQKGYFKLDDPIKLYLPNFKLNTTQDSKALKIKNILSHSSGVPRAGFNNLIESYASHDVILKALQTTPVRIPIGKKYDYNNAMFSLISDVTEATTHQSFNTSLAQNILYPLKMNRTSTTLGGIVGTDNRASPHTRGKRGGIIPCPTYSAGYYTVAPAGGINSSIKDMAIFLKAQMGANPEVINNKALARIQTPQVITKNVLQSYTVKNLIKNPQYALGWRTADMGDKRLIFHGGWLKGFTNFIGFLPEEQIGIVVLHNGDTRFSSRIGLKFLEYYLGYADTTLTPVKTSPAIKTNRLIRPNKKKSLKKKKQV